MERLRDTSHEDEEQEPQQVQLERSQGELPRIIKGRVESAAGNMAAGAKGVRSMWASGGNSLAEDKAIGTDPAEEIAGVAPNELTSEQSDESKRFLLRVIQPGLAGLMDGSVSTLAPIFATAFATHKPFVTFLVGMAAATGAGISMAFAEALSDSGDLTGRGHPVMRGGITGAMTFFGGALHTLPFLLPDVQMALYTAYVVVAFELLLIAWIRHRFFRTNWALSIVQVVGGGSLVFAAALFFGNA